MKYFVLVFETETGTLLSMTSHDTAANALEARFQRDLEHSAASSIEVVVLRAASEDAVRITHPRYFARDKQPPD
jgi:hypothetical protein